MKRTFRVYPSSQVTGSSRIVAYGGAGSIHPFKGETTEEYRARHLRNKETFHNIREAEKRRKSFMHRYQPTPYIPTFEDIAEVEEMIRDNQQYLDLPVDDVVKEVGVELGNCPYCGGIISDNGRCSYCGSKIYKFT